MSEGFHLDIDRYLSKCWHYVYDGTVIKHLTRLLAKKNSKEISNILPNGGTLMRKKD